jgi:glycosyltransferase involved in cell wall biosynthesis
VKISVQICTHNRKDLLRRSLEELFKTDFAASDYELVLVDDGGTDGTGDMVKSMNAPCRVKYLYQEKSGLAAGRNLGIKNADGEVVLFIDDDILADKDLLKEHWASHQEYPRAVIMGRVNHIESLDDDLEAKYKLADFSTSFFWTSNASVPKRFLEEAGLFDPEFTEYGWEDIEFGFRMRAIGLVRKYNQKALVHHVKSRWKASDVPRLCRQAQSSGRSAVIFLSKRPCLRSRLSTGIFALRFAWDRVLRLGTGLYTNSVKRSSDGPLSGFALLSARTLVGFEYFDSVRASLAARRGHVGEQQ